MAFRVTRNRGIPVRARFTCPDPRTIVMHIIEGEGVGSVVETHATPLAPHPDGRPRTAVIEATIAHSSRRGFAKVRRGERLARPVMEWAAGGCGSRTSSMPSASTRCGRPGAADRACGQAARRPSTVCTMPRCQPSTGAAWTSRKPASRRRCCRRSSPSKASTLRHR